MKNYNFEAQVWKSPGKGGWYFVTLPLKVTEQIRKNFQEYEEGWGRLKCQAKIENLVWETAIWFDTKAKSFLLPIKSEIRKKCGITDASIVKVEIIMNETVF